MSHPLLTKVLADAYAVEFPPIEVPGYIDPANRLREQQAFMERVTAAIPPDIADRLERALDVCAVCGLERVAYTRDRQAWTRGEHEDWAGHPYQPLIEVGP